jgi:hypothetical protein
MIVAGIDGKCKWKAEKFGSNLCEEKIGRLWLDVPVLYPHEN